MTDPYIFIISGTNRRPSNTLRVAEVVQSHYGSAGVASELFCLADLPLEIFSPEAYAKKPKAFEAIAAKVLAAAGLHVVVPEYNGSFPGILKHFIDMLKFPESFEHKPVAFVGLANGHWGGLRGVEQLQMVFGYRNAHVYPDRIFVPSVQHKLDGDGRINDAELDARFDRQARGFAKFAGLFVKRGPGTMQ